MLTKEDLINKIKLCSGPILNSPSKICYHSFHFPSLTITDAQRNTMERYNEFGISFSLAGQKVIDLGCGVGGLLFEAIRRGAISGYGIEFDQSRVDTALEITKYLSLPCNIIKLDLNGIANLDISGDVVFCGSLDAHVSDYLSLYKLMFNITKDICYFESNRGITADKIVEDLRSVTNFAEILHIGLSKDDMYPRNIFILKKEKSNSGRTRYPGLFNDELVYIGKMVKKYFQNSSVLDKIELIRQRLGNYPNFLFSDRTSSLCCERPFIGTVLDDLNLSEEDKLNYKIQLLNMLRVLRLNGVSHRDIHTKNLLVENGQLYLIDWELAEIVDIPTILVQQDIWGGENIPFMGYVFTPLKESVAVKLGITEGDFNDISYSVSG